LQELFIVLLLLLDRGVTIFLSLFFGLAGVINVAGGL